VFRLFEQKIVRLILQARAQLFENATLTAFSPGAVMMLEGEESDCLWFINKGNWFQNLVTN
jgi:hypothetical protein